MVKGGHDYTFGEVYVSDRYGLIGHHLVLVVEAPSMNYVRCLNFFHTREAKIYSLHRSVLDKMMRVDVALDSDGRLITA